MSSNLPDADRDRLAKLLGMLGSAHLGERDAAGLAAHRFLQRRGLTWQEVLGAENAPKSVSFQRPQTGWRQTVAACLRQPGALSEWEVGFLRGLAGFPRLSGKQRAILDGIADRVLEEVAA